MTQPLTFITMSPELEAARDLRDALVANEQTRFLINSEDAEQLYSDVIRLNPSAVIIKLGDSSERDTNLIRKLTSASPGTGIIIAARNASPAVIMNCLRAGAREFLQLPVNLDEFKTVISRVAEFCAEPAIEQSNKGRVVSVFSAKGGGGTSFIAANVAAACEVRTLLIDLNLQAGDLDLYLSKEPRYSIADLVKNRQRLDDSLVTSFVTPHSPHLSFLAAPLEAHEADDIKAEHVSEIIHQLRGNYRCIVLDLQHTFDPVTVGALDQSDDILLVMTLDIPGIRNARRALKIFDRLGYPRRKTHIVVNRWSKNIDAELKKVEHHLGEQIIGFVPNDYRRVMDSINLGQPLVETEPSSKIAIEIKRLARMFYNSSGNATPDAQKRRGGLRSIFSRQTMPSSIVDLHARLDEG